MKRKLKESLKPQKTFEEWAGENNIKLEEHQPKTKRRYFSTWLRQKRIIAGLSSLIAVCLIVAILLPVLLSGGSDPNTPPVPQKYTAQDSAFDFIEIDDLYNIDKLLLFETNQIVEFDIVSVYFANDDAAFILGYRIENCLIATTDLENAFYVDCRIRTYENYEFAGHQEYSNLPNSFWAGETKITYRIFEEGRDENKAKLYFAYDSIEYFLDVRGFPQVTDITEDTLKILLNDLLR